MTDNSPVCTEEHSCQGLWTTSRSPSHVSVTEVLFRFATNALGMILHPGKLEQDASITVKLFCQQLSENFGASSLRQTMCCHIKEDYNCQPNLLIKLFHRLPWRKSGLFALCGSLVANDVLCKTRMKAVMTDIIILSLKLDILFLFHRKIKIRLEKTCLSQRMFQKRWETLARVWSVSESVWTGAYLEEKRFLCKNAVSGIDHVLRFTIYKLLLLRQRRWRRRQLLLLHCCCFSCCRCCNTGCVAAATTTNTTNANTATAIGDTKTILFPIQTTSALSSFWFLLQTLVVLFTEFIKIWITLSFLLLLTVAVFPPPAPLHQPYHFLIEYSTTDPLGKYSFLH